MMGSTHQTIYMPDVQRFSTPIPPLPEQERIVAFVRRESREIDALVAKKERLIELLQEGAPPSSPTLSPKASIRAFG